MARCRKRAYITRRGVSHTTDAPTTPSGRSHPLRASTCSPLIETRGARPAKCPSCRSPLTPTTSSPNHWASSHQLLQRSPGGRGREGKMASSLGNAGVETGHMPVVTSLLPHVHTTPRSHMRPDDASAKNVNAKFQQPWMVEAGLHRPILQVAVNARVCLQMPSARDACKCAACTRVCGLIETIARGARCHLSGGRGCYILQPWTDQPAALLTEALYY